MPQPKKIPKSPRILLAWDRRFPYGQAAIPGIAAYGERFGPFEYLDSGSGDVELEDAEVFSGVDGVLIYRQELSPGADLQWPTNLPTVSLEEISSTITPWQVIPDNRAVGRLVAEELLRRGFRRLAYCSFDEEVKVKESLSSEWDRLRLAGFRQVIEQAGIEPLVYQEPWKIWGRFEEQWRGSLARWLVSLPKPVGIMAASDIRARHLLLAAGVAGIKVPEEMAVIGVNNESHTMLSTYSLSSVELDAYAAGYAAARMLHQLIKREPVKSKLIKIPPRKLVTRRSSDVMAVDDPDVISALHFIAEHATRGISVAEVVRAVPLSRRAIERRFARILHRSILDEIRSVQVARAKLLLADPAIPVRQAARVAGFGTDKAMAAIFKRITGMSPSAYRGIKNEVPD